MGQTSIPQGYSPLLSIYETQKAIACSSACSRTGSAGPCASTGCPPPLFVAASSGLNDDLNGVERPCPLRSGG